MEREQRLLEHTIDAGLFASTSAFALWLWKTKKAGEPNWTWVKVVFGTALCLGAAGLRARVRQADWPDYERSVWRAFVIGGLPVITEELIQMEMRRRELLEYLEKRSP